MDTALPNCPECSSEYTYEMGTLLVCPMCGHEWTAVEPEESLEEVEAEPVTRDSVGNELADGDTVIISQSVRVSGGGGGTIRAGTKVRNIRLVEDRGDGHDIEARVDEFGRMKLKSSIVKKA